MQTEKQKISQNRNNYIRTLRAVYWASSRIENPSKRFMKSIDTELARLKVKTVCQQIDEMERNIRNKGFL